MDGRVGLLADFEVAEVVLQFLAADVGEADGGDYLAAQLVGSVYDGVILAVVQQSDGLPLAVFEADFEAVVLGRARLPEVEVHAGDARRAFAGDGEVAVSRPFDDFVRWGDFHFASGGADGQQLQLRHVALDVVGGVVARGLEACALLPVVAFREGGEQAVHCRQVAQGCQFRSRLVCVQLCRIVLVVVHFLLQVAGVPVEVLEVCRRPPGFERMVHGRYRLPIFGHHLCLHEPWAHFVDEQRVFRAVQEPVGSRCEQGAARLEFADGFGVALGGTVADVGNLAAFVAAEAMAVGAEVLVVGGKCAQRRRLLGEHLLDGALPRCRGVVCRHVPRIVRHAVQADFRGFGILHGIAHEAAEQRGNVQVVAVGRAEEQAVADEVGDGIVPPDVGLALQPCVDPLHALLINIVYHGVSRPHHLDAGMQPVAQCLQVWAFVRTPCAVVFCGAEQERCDVAVALYEDVVHIVEQFGLFLAFCALAPNVVEEYGK